MSRYASRMISFAEEFLTSFPTDVTNLFHYIMVALNLPGTENYQPSLPWFRLLDSNNNLATILVIYVDDERIHSSSHQQALAATRQVSSRESYLGIQDAARKRRPPSQQHGLAPSSGQMMMKLAF